MSRSDANEKIINNETYQFNNLAQFVFAFHHQFSVLCLLRLPFRQRPPHCRQWAWRIAAELTNLTPGCAPCHESSNNFLSKEREIV